MEYVVPIRGNAFPCLDLIDAVLISEINSSPRIRVHISNFALIARTILAPIITSLFHTHTHSIVLHASLNARVHASVLVFVKIR